MKNLTKFVAALLSLGLVPGLTAQNAPQPRHRELTVWINANMGTLIGGGYASSYLTDIKSKTLRNEDQKLREALDRLDRLGMLPVKGFGLVPAAVAWQTELPMRTIIEQQAETDLSYAELLMVNALAGKSRQSFDRVISLRVKSKTWGDVGDQLGVDMGFVIGKAKLAAARIRQADDWTRARPMRATDPSYTGLNVHNSVRANYY